MPREETRGPCRPARRTAMSSSRLGATPRPWIPAASLRPRPRLLTPGRPLTRRSEPLASEDFRSSPRRSPVRASPRRWKRRESNPPLELLARAIQLGRARFQPPPTSMVLEGEWVKSPITPGSRNCVKPPVQPALKPTCTWLKSLSTARTKPRWTGSQSGVEATKPG